MSAMHTSAPPGYKCADCSIDQKPCAECSIVGAQRRPGRGKLRWEAFGGENYYRAKSGSLTVATISLRVSGEWYWGVHGVQMPYGFKSHGTTWTPRAAKTNATRAWANWLKAAGLAT